MQGALGLQEAIVKYMWPWQQVLMIFARTQKEHAWKSPGYKFTRQQQEAWEALIRTAMKAAREADDDTDEEVDKEADEEADEEMDEERDEEAEADKEQGNANAGRAEGNQLATLLRIQKACLRFYIALLEQHITRREYDSLLVCALAVLSVKEEGWKGAEQYPSILLAMIKVAQFIAVQQGLELA
jgi:hypothetical protein